MPPHSIHQWRQCDGLSFALNYYHEEISFWEPRMHWVGKKENGKAVAEFPIIYYTVAKLWKLFGKHYFIFRLVNILITFAGLYALFKLTVRLTSSNFLGMVVSFLLYSSPLVAFYGNNFLPNIPALSTAIIGCYFYLRYYQTQAISNLYWMGLFIAITGLLKASTLMIFIVIGFIHFYHLVILERSRFLVVLKNVLPFLFSVCAVGAWYLYSKEYNNNNINFYFVLSPQPIWLSNAQKIKFICVNLYNNLFTSIFSFTLFHIILLMFISNLLYFRRCNRFLLTLNVLMFVFSSCYFILFFNSFDVHDYYLIDLIPFFICTLITNLDWIKEILPLKALKFRIIFLLFTFFLVYNTAVKIRWMYDSNDPIARYSFVLDKNVDGLLWWFHDHSEKMNKLQEVEPYLRSLNIKRSDKVISMPDVSVNISLSMMDQKGFSEYGYWDLQRKDRIDTLVRYGARYLIIHDPALLQEPDLQSFYKTKIGEINNVSIFKIAP
jgi:hypothetical protein